MFERLREAAGSKKHATPHTARHSATTAGILLAHDVSAVSSLLRHASLNTTNRYLHFVDARRRHLASQLAVMIPPEILPPQGPGHGSPGAAVTRGSEPEILDQFRQVASASDLSISEPKNALDGQEDLGDVEAAA